MKIKIIDCTIRDGGHLNKWQFADRLVRSAYFAAQKGGVDYFEIGYKNDPAKSGLGAYGYCDEEKISALFKCSAGCKLLFMLDAGKYTGYPIPDCKSAKTPFSGVRIAAYPYEAQVAIGLVEKLHKQGYEVFLNLMASAEWTDKDLFVLKKWKHKKLLKAIYFADSFGAYGPAEISAFIRKLKKLGFAQIGFHAHNNLQMAFANTMHAIGQGATYVDASVYGMGRGSGNLPVEILLSYLNKAGQENKYNVVPYLDVIQRFFLSLFEEFRWGYSLNSLLGGISNVHPYYIDELFGSHNYTIEEIWNILGVIKEKCPISFSGEKLKNALGQRFYVPNIPQTRSTIQQVEKELKIIPAKDSFLLRKLPIKDKHRGKSFLIIANGPSIVKYKDKINALIKKKNLITIGCNFLNKIYEPDYHLFVNKSRFLKYVSAVSEKSTLIVPSFFGKHLVKENYKGGLEYIQINPENTLKVLPVKGISQQTVYLNVATSAILTAFQMGAQEIMAVGMDGYQSQEPGKVVYFYNEKDIPDDKITASVRYENLAIELKRVADFLHEQGTSFSIITPTSHKRYYQDILG
jgi:4-hydroxy 2-oxovalerate aldolase